MEKKFTYVNAIDNALNGVLDEATVEKLEALKTSLTKKSANKGEKKVNANDEPIKARVLEVLAEGRKTVTEMVVAGGFPTNESGVTTTQMLAPRVKALVAEGKVAEVTEKGKKYFSLA